ncbi:MAG: hypothetical protein WC451_01655 [Patescibacteria group bacterium]
MTTQENISIAIEKIISDFKEYPDKYLTEDDVRCFLFNELMKIDEFSLPIHTSDNSKSITVHSEVRWYGNSGKLKWRSDIVIVDVSTLRVKNDIFKLPSKGFGFNRPKVIIEIKLRRINGESDNGFINQIRKDLDKVSKIKQEISGNFISCLLVLDKKRDLKDGIDHLGQSGIEIFYQFASSSLQLQS